MRQIVWGLLLSCCLFSCPSHADEFGFYSLGYDKVNLHAGPAERFPIKWVYQEKNYPVEVIDSFEDWRQVREADGTIGWIQEDRLKNVRYVVIQDEDKLLSAPNVTGKVIAYVQPGVIARVQVCPEGDYCLLQFTHEDKKVEGWFPRRFVWGLYDGEIIE